MCKKQTSVSHSSTESEIISLDAGLRLDGIPALDSWDLNVLVLGNTTQNHDRTGKPVVCPQRRAQQFVIEDDETESDLSFGSRSFINRVSDQVRKRQKRISNVTENGEKHSMIWGMFMSSTLQSSVFMGKSYSDNWHSIKNTKDLTMKQMSTYLRNWYPNKMRYLWSENNWLGKLFMEVLVFDW